MTSCALLLVSAAAAGQLPDNVLLNFSATWCGPCQQVKPTVNKLIRQGLPVRKVDVDREPALMRRFGVRSVPTFILLVGGKEVRRVKGYQSERNLRDLLARIPKRTEPVKPVPHTAPPIPEAPPKSLYADRTPDRRFQLPRTEPGRRTGITIRGNNDGARLAKGTGIPVDPMAASVRIRVRDDNGINYGSGTIVDSRRGRSVIVTCAHVFRDVKGKTVVEVDLFEGNRVRQYTGKVLTYDLKADVGLVSIATEEPVATVPVAAVGTPIRNGDRVVGIGCGGGDPPKRLSLQVTGVNRYLGPDNLECTGMPKQGRSGGGLFDGKGRLIGVCFAAEPKNRRGLYAGLRPIHTMLKQANIRLGTSASTQVAAATDSRTLPETRRTNTEGTRSAVHVDQRQLALMQVPLSNGAKTEQVAEYDPGPFPAVPQSRTQPEPKLNRSPIQQPRTPPEHQLKSVDDIVGKVGEAEVVCIIRPLGDPRAQSRVVIINRASPKFVRYLRNEVDHRPRKTHYRTAAAASSPVQPKLVSPFRQVSRQRVRTTGEPGRYRRSASTRFTTTQP